MHFWWSMPTPKPAPISSRPRRAALERGAAATQCRYELELPYSRRATSLERLRVLAFRGINVLRARGRAELGFSSGVFGNGFAVDGLDHRAAYPLRWTASAKIWSTTFAWCWRVCAWNGWKRRMFTLRWLRCVLRRSRRKRAGRAGAFMSLRGPRQDCWRRLRAATGAPSKCLPRPGACRFRAAFWP